MAKNCVCKQELKTASEGDCLMCDGKSFHIYGAAAVKALSSLSLCCIFVTSEVVWSANLRE